MTKKGDINKIKISKNFDLYEFECPCCEDVKISTALIYAVQQLRDIVCKPISFNSAYRCYLHNLRVKGSETSQHREGKAVDILESVLPASYSVDSLRQCGFTTVLYYPQKHFWHLDVRDREFYCDLHYAVTQSTQRA